jgi:two-component system sensor histidine kinase UhpB
LDKHLTIQVFRVIQECLTNVVRHAQAHKVQIDLDQQPQLLELKVQDDGVGCDLQTLTRGFGLLGIKERIRSLDGELTVVSKPQAGMTITARIPLA